jgi:hypothetical protein
MLVIALVSIILLAWVLFRYRQGKNKQHHEPHTYHCVTIETGAQCCKAVEKLAKKRFLSVDAPLFPLENCQAQDCQCRYTHYEDRRDEHGSRRSDFGLSHELFGGDGQSNRREPKKVRRQRDKYAN